ncbi:argininosuccinate lyase, partial [Candidatus Micrarchaeota archaeon]|nr:argininosuccinate lyase [Candidatus Micrarchaeota archaeon]
QKEILSTSEYEGIRTALKALYSHWELGQFILKTELEDVHMNVEHAVTTMTSCGKKMHTARSRNDQVLLDMRLYMRDQVLFLLPLLSALSESFAKLSKKDGAFVAYTHTRVAQPITISFWCSSWVKSFKRDSERLCDSYKRVNQNPLGACAVAGTSWNIDRSETARFLAFSGVQENELDTITSRGECEVELLSVLSIIMCKLSRLSEELIWLSEKGLVEISEEYTTGSSIMPNKKNPDVLELIRGRTGRVYGNLTHSLTTLKGLISGYHSDMQETKFAIMSGFSTTNSSLKAMAMVVSGLKFNKEAIEHELDLGFAQATEIADYLASCQVPFREAHEKSGTLVRFCEKEGKLISQLDQTAAEKILDIKLSGKWGTLKSFERVRLKRVVRIDPSTTVFVKKETEKIKKAYSSL